MGTRTWDKKLALMVCFLGLAAVAGALLTARLPEWLSDAILLWAAGICSLLAIVCLILLLLEGREDSRRARREKRAIKRQAREEQRSSLSDPWRRPPKKPLDGFGLYVTTPEAGRLVAEIASSKPHWQHFASCRLDMPNGESVWLEGGPIGEGLRTFSLPPRCSLLEGQYVASARNDFGSLYCAVRFQVNSKGQMVTEWAGWKPYREDVGGRTQFVVQNPSEAISGFRCHVHSYKGSWLADDRIFPKYLDEAKFPECTSLGSFMFPRDFYSINPQGKLPDLPFEHPRLQYWIHPGIFNISWHGWIRDGKEDKCIFLARMILRTNSDGSLLVHHHPETSN